MYYKVKNQGCVSPIIAQSSSNIYKCQLSYFKDSSTPTESLCKCAIQFKVILSLPKGKMIKSYRVASYRDSKKKTLAVPIIMAPTASFEHAPHFCTMMCMTGSTVQVYNSCSVNLGTIYDYHTVQSFSHRLDRHLFNVRKVGVFVRPFTP